MKNIVLVGVFAFAISFASCSGNKADGTNDAIKENPVTADDSIRATKSGPPADSTMADSTTNAPKIVGQ